MAKNTTLNATLQARDWELIKGLMGHGGDDMAELIFSLKTHYRSLTTKPSGSDNISISTQEGVMVGIAKMLSRIQLNRVHRDTGASPYNRIMTAIRAMNNAADNYITTEFTAMDAEQQTVYADTRKAGRKELMMSQYDNN